MSRNRITITGMLLAAGLLAGLVSPAQPFTLDDKINPTELLLVDYKKEDGKRKGRINITSVTQVKDTMYFFMQGLSMYSPAYFSLHTGKSGKPVRVKLCKNNWNDAEREGETDNNHQWNTKFKTEGDFGIMVIAEQTPAIYTLLTWVGDEAKNIGMSSPFSDSATPAGKEKSDRAGEKSFLQQYGLLAGIILVLLAVIAFLLLKRKK